MQKKGKVANTKLWLSIAWMNDGGWVNIEKQKTNFPLVTLVVA